MESASFQSILEVSLILADPALDLKDREDAGCYGFLSSITMFKTQQR